MRRFSGALSVLAAFALTPALLAGCVGPTAAGSSPAAAPPGAAPASGSALAAVEGLAVKGRAPMTGYDRELFGPAWADVDHNGCDTRNDVLRRDMVDVVAKEGTNDCVIASGTFADPYSGETIAFAKGQDTSSLVQIDHVVALGDAWQKGAQGWAPQQREVFANDPLNLMAAKGELNSQKGAGDTATWLPPNAAFRCAYVARQVAVKAAYGLWVTQAEKDAMVGVLSGCPEEPLPAPSSVTPTAPGAAPAEPAPAEPAPDAPAATAPYESCDAARAAGAAPLHDGDPGYNAKLDGDADGVACED